MGVFYVFFSKVQQHVNRGYPDTGEWGTWFNFSLVDLSVCLTFFFTQDLQSSRWR